MGWASSTAHAGQGAYTSLTEGGVAFSGDEEGRALYVGVPASVLDDDGRMDVIATVGTNQYWHDDLVDEGSAGVELK